MEFFEKIGDKLSSKGKEVTKKAKDLTDVARLNSKINEHESMLKDVYIKIGKKYYEESKNNPNPEYLDMYQMVIDIQGTIESSKEEIAQIKGIRKCIGCNGDMTYSAVFCPSCGTKNEIIEVQSHDVEETNAAFCPGCGLEIGEDTVFCASCGAKVK